jgi:hypothetical protein
MDNEEIAQLEAHYQNEIESIKGEVARLTDLLEQVLSSKNKKGIFAQLDLDLSKKEKIQLKPRVERRK